MILRIGKLAITALFCLASFTAQAQLSVNVDRQQITDADLLKLSIRIENATTAANPDFSSIERDFEIVSRAGPNQSSRISIINGRQTSEVYVAWEFRLRPKRLGQLTIPAFRIGSETSAPIPITVTQQTAAMKRKMSQLVFFDTSVDTNETYVQGQIIYTIKLYYVENISGDFPPPPQIPDAVIETIESERRYDSITNGRRYYVLEKSYGIYPQSSGTLTIPPQIFSGFRVGPGFFSTREPVLTKSDSHTINVKPKPAEFDGDHWLPAESVTLEERWAKQPPEFQVGEPVNRTIIISAEGIATSLLPQIENGDIEGAKTYQDPAVEDQVSTENGLKSTLTTVIGIVPTKAGKMVLPEIRIPWWNTRTDTLEVAVIPEQTYKVAPAAGVQVQAPIAPAPDITTQSTGLSRPEIIVSDNLRYWQYASITLLVLWLITLILWAIQRRNTKPIPPVEPTPKLDTEGDLYKRFTQACKDNDGTKAQQLLTAWVKLHFPNISSLQQWLGQLNDDSLTQAVKDLEQANFAPDSSIKWQGQNLLTAVEQNRPDNKRANKKVPALAPALNPV